MKTELNSAHLENGVSDFIGRQSNLISHTQQNKNNICLFVHTGKKKRKIRTIFPSKQNRHNGKQRKLKSIFKSCQHNS